MNNPDLRPDDEQLGAWLDGELDAAALARVQAWLQDHPEEAARVRAWAADRDALRVRLDATLAEPLPAPWAQRLSALAQGTAPRPRLAANAPRWRRVAAVAGLMLASGLGGAWLQRQGGDAAASAMAGTPAVSPGAAPWLQRAAVAHAVYVPEQRHPVELDLRDGDARLRTAREQHLAQWLSQRVQAPVHLFDLRAQGFELVGGRLLPDAGGPGAQLMYQRADGQRVTLYLRRPEDPKPVAFQHEQVHGLGVYYWVEDGAGCAMVGNLPPAQMQVLADALYAQAEQDEAPGQTSVH